MTARGACIRTSAATTLVASFIAFAAGCGTDAVGVDSCRQIERARCRAAPACAVAIDPPHHTSGSDVDACIRYYDVACLHGLAVGDPGTTRVDECVAAIEGGDCSLVRAPVTGACAWLAPAATVAADDASTDDTSGGDGSTDNGSTNDGSATADADAGSVDADAASTDDG